MEVRLLALVSYWVSSATLGAWVLEQAWVLIRRVRAWRFRNQLGGRMLFINDGSQVANRKSLLLTTAGMVMGGFAVSWVGKMGFSRRFAFAPGGYGGLFA